MKKVLWTVGLAVMVCCLIGGTCGKPKVAGVDKAMLATAEKIKQAEGEDGFKVKCEVQDVNKNGEPDLVVTYISGPGDKSPAYFLGHVTANVVLASRDGNVQPDLVVVRVAGEEYKAKVSDCAKCVDLFTSGASADEVGQCIVDAYGLE